MEMICRFKEIRTDISYIGLHRGEFGSYFCTPLKAVIFASLRVDGIHFCVLPSEEDKTLEDSPVYVVSPCMPEHYVEPVAKNFADFLNLVVATKDAGAMECISYMSKEAFINYLKDIPEEKEEIIKAIEGIQENFTLRDIPEVYDYVKSVQQDVRLREVKFSQEYYEVTGEEDTI